MLALLVVSPLCLRAEETDLPEFASGNGITVLKTSWMDENKRTVVVDIQTQMIAEEAINGGVNQVWITLPKNYSSKAKVDHRYPVLYLMHGGGGGWAGQWVQGGGQAEEYTEDLDLITVMPDAGKVGWFTDWVGDGSRCAQKWESFHIKQLIPWVDANLRTNASKSGRAIAGLSMGGFGAFHHAFRHPELFAYAGSYSGALDLQEQGTQLVILQQSQSSGFDPYGAFGRFDDDNWNVHNPLKHAGSLSGIYLDMYAGSGMHDFDVLERTMGQSTFRLHNALNDAGITSSFLMYGRPGGETGCDGGHNFGCWNYALKLSLPKMMNVLRQAGSDGSDEEAPVEVRAVEPPQDAPDAAPASVDWAGNGGTLPAAI